MIAKDAVSLPGQLGSLLGTAGRFGFLPGFLLISIGCFLLMQFNIGHQPEFDELYHVLAAQGWLEHGELRIAEGVYERVSLFTYLTAWMFDLFGASLEVGRQPSVIACALLAGLVFAWCWREIGPAAAWVTGLLLATSPFLIEIGQFIRFYALQALSFWIATVCVYSLLKRGQSWHWRFFLAIVATISMVAAGYFQPVTIVGAGGLGIWVVGTLIHAWMQERGGVLRHQLLILLGSAFVLSLLAGLILSSDFGQQLIAKYRWVPVWGQSLQSNFAVYHAWLLLLYPTLWSLVPILTLVAVAAYPRPSWFALSIFLTAFLLQSFAGVKELRYIFYSLPYLYVIWGIALAVVLSRFLDFIRDHLKQISDMIPAGFASVMRPVFWVASVGFILLANAATIRSATMLAGITVPPERSPIQWDLARPILQPWLDNADVVITSSELETFYFLGRYDILFSHSRLDEIGNEQLARDFRTGRPVIDDPDMLAKIVSCHDSGLIISPTFRWRNAAQIDNATADRIVQIAEPLELPKDSQLVAYTWDQPGEVKSGSDCPIW